MEKSPLNPGASGVGKISRLIRTLRGSEGCPWDRKQTPRTMSTYLVEEIYELLEAIESGSPEQVCEELGDVLFHLVFIAALFEEMGHFNLDRAAAMNVRKMIRRHPHVFGDESAQNCDDIRKRWHQIKQQEKKQGRHDSLLDSVPAKLPALMRAYRISERAARTGFDWDDLGGVMRQVEAEWAELKAEVDADQQDSAHANRVALEFGDVLFTLVNVARFTRIHPETALTSSVKKFEKRFRYMEKAAAEQAQSLDALSRDEMERLWKEAKTKTDD